MGVLDWLGPLLAPKGPEDAAIARAALSPGGIGTTLAPTSEDYARILEEERAKLLAEQSQSDAALGIAGKKPPSPPPVPPPVPPSTKAPPTAAPRPTPTVPGAPPVSLGKITPSFGPAEPPPMPGVSSYGSAATSFDEPPAPIRAEMVNGKLVFTNRPSLGGTEVDYDKGVNQWQDRALVDQELLADSRGEAVKRAAGDSQGSMGGYDGPAIRTPEDSRFRDFTIQRTPERAPGPARADQTGFRGSYIPSAPVPDVAGLDQTGFEQKMAEMTKSASPGAQDEFKQRYLEQEGIRQEIAKRSLVEGQAAQAQGVGAQGQAEAALTGAKTDILKSPEADAIRRGVASAETIVAFKGRIDKEAAAAVQAKYGDKLTETINTLVKSGLAPTPQAALKKLLAVEYDAILMGNPDIKIALTKATGGILSGGV